MTIRNEMLFGLCVMALVPLVDLSASGQEVKLVERPPDPHGSPRPARCARNVPVNTSIYFEVAISTQIKVGDVDPEALSVVLQEQGGAMVELLQPGGRFTEGGSGWLRPKQDLQGASRWPFISSRLNRLNRMPHTRSRSRLARRRQRNRHRHLPVTGASPPRPWPGPIARNSRST